jgi:hypothetical protein
MAQPRRHEDVRASGNIPNFSTQRHAPVSFFQEDLPVSNAWEELDRAQGRSEHGGRKKISLSLVVTECRSLSRRQFLYWQSYNNRN